MSMKPKNNGIWNGMALRLQAGSLRAFAVQKWGKSMNIVVIDAQGGGIGRQIIAAVRSKYPDVTITAVGTNSAATSAMLKAGASQGATGENAVIVNCRNADVIIGPIGIVIADSMLGEITEQMAAAVGRSSAKRILIPMNRCDNLIAGVAAKGTGALIEDAMRCLETVIA